MFFRDLGIGVGLRAPHVGRFLDGKPSSVSWVEVISENYMDWESRPARRPLQALERVRANVPVALHGVSLSLGSCDPLDERYLARLKALADAIQPAWVSDHLCWIGVDGENLHDLMPLPCTAEALDHVVSRIARAQERLGRRILVENVSSYVDFPGSEMTEWEFLAEVARRADCGLLLDVNNVYVSARNHGFDPIEYLAAIPRERVGQIHLAGHRCKGDFLIDTHDQPVCDEVWALYGEAVARFGQVSAMIERDDNIPSWEELEKELVKLGSLRSAHASRQTGLEKETTRERAHVAAAASARV